MPNTPIIDLAWVEIDGKLCRAGIELSINEESGGLETVKTLNPERKAIGYKEGSDDYSFSITHKRTIPLEIDYRAFRANRTVFTVAYQELAGNTLGKKYQLLDCRVQSVEKGFTADGEVADVVQCLALDHIED
jgi:hypothetical protein